MNEQSCKQRDDYLLDELESDQRTEFEQHLSECDSCRAFVEAQSRIDQILTDAASFVKIPSSLSDRIESTVVTARRRQRMVLATWVAMPIVAGLFALMYFSAEPHNAPNTQTEIVQKPEQIEPKVEPQQDADSILVVPTTPPVQVEVSGDVLAMQIESGDPNVTLIQIFEVSPYSHGKLK